MRILKALAVTLGIMVWCTALVAIPLMVPSPPGWVVGVWLWVFLGPMIFAFVYNEVN